MQPRTIYQVLEETAAQFGDAPALRQPFTEKDGKREYLTYSWNQYQTAAQEIAAGLRSLGIRKGDIVALDSETRLEFYLADLGILAAGSRGGRSVSQLSAKGLIRTIQNCGAKALFVEDPKTLQALHGAPDMPRILLTGEAEGALSLDELRARGRLALAAETPLHGALKGGGRACRLRDSVSDLRRHGRAQDGAGHAFGGSREHGYGARQVAYRA